MYSRRGFVKLWVGGVAGPLVGGGAVLVVNYE